MQNPQFQYESINNPAFSNSSKPLQQKPVEEKSDWRFLAVSAFITIVSLNVIWWIYPNVDVEENLNNSYASMFILVGLYTFGAAASFFISFNQFIKSYWTLIPIGLSFLIALNFRTSYNYQIAILLILFSVFFLLMQIKIIGLKNFFGLITFSAMAATALPMGIFFLKHNHVSGAFISSTFPLMVAFAFYMTPIFIAKRNLARIVSFIFGVILIAYHVYLGVNTNAYIAIGLIVFTWVVLINLNLRQKYRQPTFTLLLMIDALILYLQQKG
ncbi:MAG: hypothetical protein LBM27_03430 [Lactobacillaceae bacterium]|jgi:hypothetical protein|nr:hypothetical protein [Lactobacillaceae bacterium]